jgi:hypothetical protein
MSSRKRRPDETIEEYRKNLKSEREQEWFKKKGKFIHSSKTFEEKYFHRKGRTYKKGEGK